MCVRKTTTFDACLCQQGRHTPVSVLVQLRTSTRSSTVHPSDTPLHSQPSTNIVRLANVGLPVSLTTASPPKCHGSPSSPLQREGEEPRRPFVTAPSAKSPKGPREFRFQPCRASFQALLQPHWQALPAKEHCRRHRYIVDGKFAVSQTPLAESLLLLGPKPFAPRGLTRSSGRRGPCRVQSVGKWRPSAVCRWHQQRTVATKPDPRTQNGSSDSP